MFNFFPPRRFCLLCPPTDGLLSLNSLPACFWELWACIGLAWLSSRPTWVSSLPVHTVLLPLVKKSVRYHKYFWLLSFIGPLLLNPQKGIYYRTKAHEFNSVPALLIFRPAHSIILLYCWLSSVAIRDLLGAQRLLFIVFSQCVLCVSLCLPSFYIWQVSDLNPLLIKSVHYRVTLWAKSKTLLVRDTSNIAKWSFKLPPCPPVESPLSVHYWGCPISQFSRGVFCVEASVTACMKQVTLVWYPGVRLVTTSSSSTLYSSKSCSLWVVLIQAVGIQCCLL